MHYIPFINGFDILCETMPMKMGFTSFSFPKDKPMETIIESVRESGFQV